jgi:hypothetical protein
MEPMNGYSFSSETQVASQVADDFLCKDGLPIIKVTWWGSYWDSLYNGTNYYPQPNSGAWGDPIPNPPGTVSSFIINFYQDVPAQTGVPPWSHPGAQLYAETMDLDGVQVTETFFGTINRQGSIETVYEYTATLPVGRPFKQEAGISTGFPSRPLIQTAIPFSGGGMNQRIIGTTTPCKWGIPHKAGGISCREKTWPLSFKLFQFPQPCCFLVRGLLSCSGCVAGAENRGVE